MSWWEVWGVAKTGVMAERGVALLALREGGVANELEAVRENGVCEEGGWEVREERIQRVREGRMEEEGQWERVRKERAGQ